jgi:hypothetical protein
MEWIEPKSQLPPLNTMVLVKTRTRSKETHYWETHFETELIRRHVLLKWRVTHWRLAELPEGVNHHKQVFPEANASE